MDLYFGRTCIQGEAKLLEISRLTSELVGIIHEAVYFRGFIEFGSLKY